MIWNKNSIVAELKALHKKGRDLSYMGLAKKHQALVSAAAYHFKSYRNAVEKAGIDYAEVSRRPRWTKQHVIAAIKAAKRKGQDLNWASVTKRRDELGKAGFAAIQGRLFGNWNRALHAAGLDSDEASRYRRWDKNIIIYELKAMVADGDHVNSGAVQISDAGLHAAALRYFGSYDQALQAAKLSPTKIRKRKSRRE